MRSAARPFDDLLAELAQGDAVARQVGVLLDHAQHVARGGIGIHAQQQVGRRKMEEAERVRLHELAAVQQLAQQDGGLGNLARP